MGSGEVNVNVAQADSEVVAQTDDEVMVSDFHQHQIQHIGFVEVFEPPEDPVVAQRRCAATMPADFVRIWTTHFHVPGSPSAINIPPDWAAFFTAALMNPGSFDWARIFLSSPAWDYFSSSSASQFPFTLPSKCLVKDSSSCFVGSGHELISSLEEMTEATADMEEDATKSFGTPSEEDVQYNVSPSNGPWSAELLRKAGKLPLIVEDSGICRSDRRKA
ncbi:hypothetical protein HU200_058243 [Digitaria exilis]|uniref:Uncharacterized protein n=1 Tax=Digitaria exilis TaxID=1010633 RepID=A0A835AE68_9POAL|nr:hypothetical protein HU200_058243 [Digitaria exilis]